MLRVAVAFSLVAVLVLAGCASTNPGDGAGIYYRLPRTDAVITLGIDITGCKPAARFEKSLKVDAIAGAREGLLHVSGVELTSGVTKRVLSVGVDERGVIKSVNSTTTDQRAVILGNIIKIASSIAAVVAWVAPKEDTDAGMEPTYPQLKCLPETARVVDQLRQLKSKVVAEKAKLNTGTDPIETQKRIDALASQIALSKAALHRDIKANVRLDPSLKRSGIAETGPQVSFDYAPLWEIAIVIESGDPIVDMSSETYAASTMSLLGVTVHYVDEPQAQRAVLQSDASSSSKACKQSLVIPGSKIVKVIATPTGSLVTGTPLVEGGVISQVMPASQLAKDGGLCLSAGFAENRVVNLAFDKFGWTTDFTWNSDAQVANATSAFAGYAPDASSLVTKVQGRDLAGAKRELDELTTEQALRKARACQAQLDAGASKCD